MINFLSHERLCVSTTNAARNSTQHDFFSFPTCLLGYQILTEPVARLPTNFIKFIQRAHFLHYARGSFASLCAPLSTTIHDAKNRWRLCTHCFTHVHSLHSVLTVHSPRWHGEQCFVPCVYGGIFLNERCWSRALSLLLLHSWTMFAKIVWVAALSWLLALNAFDQNEPWLQPLREIREWRTWGGNEIRELFWWTSEVHFCNVLVECGGGGGGQHQTEGILSLHCVCPIDNNSSKQCEWVTHHGGWISSTRFFIFTTIFFRPFCLAFCLTIIVIVVVVAALCFAYTLLDCVRQQCTMCAAFF